MFGGAETRYYEIASRLVKRGHEVTIITGRGDITSKNPNSKKFKRSEIIDNYKIKRVFDYQAGSIAHGTRSIRNCFLLGKNSRYFSNYLRRNQELDVLDINAIPHLHLPILDLFNKSPSIITWHEVWGSYWRGLRKLSKLGKEMEIFNAQLGNERIAVSRFTANRLRDISISKSHPINIIENGVSADFFDINANCSDNPIFLYVGRFVAEKNIHSILIKSFSEVCKQYPKAKLNIIGDGFLKNHLQRITKDNRNITIKSNLSPEKLLKVYSSANVFVLPSSREGSGIAAREANAAGLPVVTTDFSDNAVAHEMVKHNYNGIISTAKDFADGMIHAYEKKDKMRKNGINEARNFSWDKQVEKIEIVYDRVIES